MSRLDVLVSAKLHQAARVRAARSNMTIAEVVEAALRAYLRRSRGASR